MVMPIGSFEVSKIICSSLKKEIINSKKILIISSCKGYLEEQILNLKSSLILDSRDIQIFLDLKINKKIRVFIKYDLDNIDYSLFKEKSYDLIIYLEVIEHINNPWTLLELQRSLISKKGKIIISTPNPINTFSRVHHLLNDRFLYFYKKDMYERYEPTNSIFFWELLKVLKHTKLKSVKLLGVKCLYLSKNIFKSLFNIFEYLFSFLIRIRSVILIPEETTKKDFKTSLYFSQLSYVNENK